MPRWPSAEFDSFCFCLMTLTVADWYQEELQLIHNCVPWVPVENSLFLVCVFLLPHLFTFTPAWYVADSVCEIMLDCLNCGGNII